MGLSDYNINPLMGGYDWASIINSPYFKAVWQTPNVNFKGNTETNAKTETTSGTSALSSAAGQTTADGAIPVTQAANESSSTLGALTGVGAVLALGGGALFLLKKGNLGKASEVVKSVFRGGKAESSSVSTILQRLTAVKGQDSKIKFLIPGKTTTVTGETAIADLTGKYGIQSAVTGERLAYSPATSVVESFRYKAAGENFTVHTKDGVITKIVDNKGNEVLKRFTEAQEKSADSATFEKMENALKELVKEEKEADKALFRDVDNIQYSNIFGDDVVKAYLERYGAAPKIKQFTTLERFDFSSPEMQKLVLSSDEKVFAQFAESNLMTKGGRFSKSRLADGLRVSNFSEKIGDNEYFFEGVKLVKIRDAAGIDYPVDSAKYIELVTKNEKEITKLIKKVYEDRTEIPVGATIIPE